jgi:hypothetical protein
MKNSYEFVGIISRERPTNGTPLPWSSETHTAKSSILENFTKLFGVGQILLQDLSTIESK